MNYTANTREDIMIREKLKDIVRLIGKARLYGRIGLKRATPLRAYMMFRYWILTTIFRKKIPWLIEFSVTYRCQCRCKHCSVSNYFAEAQAGKRMELTADQIKNVLVQAVKMGIPKVDLFGGEPLLRDDAIELIRFGASKGLHMSLTTNAVLLNRDMIRKLKEAGIACINISLDSADKDEHDGGRGVSGLWQKAVDGIKCCHEEEVTCIASTFVTRDRIKGFGLGESDNSHLRKIIAFSKEINASALRILFPIISGEWADTTQIEFSESEERTVIDSIDTSFAFIEGAYSVRKRKKVCQALSGKILNISPYGDIQLCSAFTDTFGNVMNAPLECLIRGMWNHPIYLKNKDGSCCNNAKLRR